MVTFNWINSLRTALYIAHRWNTSTLRVSSNFHATSDDGILQLLETETIRATKKKAKSYHIAELFLSRNQFFNYFSSIF